MPWSRIAFAEGFESANCRWVRTVFQHVYEHAPDEEFDSLALYRDLADEGVTLFFSPRGTARLRAAMSRFNLIECERPNAESVELVIGPPLAARPDWCDLSPAERLAEAEEAYANALEVNAPSDETANVEATS